jgi:uncharacterized phage protein (TIGR01671 family)
MSREIKFRGIATQTKEFIYGDLITEVGHKHILPEDADSFDDFLSVEYDTVGQYTGLEDKNGKEIYEGDLVKEKKCYGYVLFDEGKMKIKWVRGHMNFSDSLWHHKECLSVIGNIHKNPKLLKLKP